MIDLAIQTSVVCTVAIDLETLKLHTQAAEFDCYDSETRVLPVVDRKYLLNFGSHAPSMPLHVPPLELLEGKLPPLPPSSAATAQVLKTYVMSKLCYVAHTLTMPRVTMETGGKSNVGISVARFYTSSKAVSVHFTRG